MRRNLFMENIRFLFGLLLFFRYLLHHKAVVLFRDEFRDKKSFVEKKKCQAIFFRKENIFLIKSSTEIVFFYLQINLLPFMKKTVECPNKLINSP